MIKGNLRNRINLETILENVSEYDIYRYYLGRDFKLNTNINSPFRRDSTPSFGIFVTSSGRLKHTDFGDTKYKGNCVEFVMQLHDIDFKSAIQKIYVDLGIADGKVIKFQQPLIKLRYKKKIQVISKPFTDEELAYWAQFHITRKELADNQIYSVKKLYIDRKEVPNTNNLLRFAYIFDDGNVKIYTPYAKEKDLKFITNAPIDLISGLDKLSKGDKVIVTKSLKDEIILRKFIPNVCSVQAENIKAINEDTIRLLRYGFKRVIINFDSDSTGVETCKHYNQYGFDYINVPKEYLPIKDFSDLAKEKGLEEVKKVLYDKKIL